MRFPISHLTQASDKMKKESPVELDLKVKFLTWASCTISLVAETENPHNSKLAHALRYHAGSLREIAAVIAARQTEQNSSE